MLLLYFFIVLFVNNSYAAKPKNVIIIVADDLGFNDVSYRGSTEIPTYNIDALAYNGIILNNYRTPPLCTPSRSSLMTGKYPHHLGMQHFVIPSDEPWGLSPSEKIMPQYFKDAGYVTRMVGKWHLGFFEEQYTPNNRGYDSFFGYLGPYIDYWDYTLNMFDRNFSRGYDMRENQTINRNIPPNKYATELFTEEAVKVITTHDKKKPLFLVVNHLAPHAGNEDVPMQAKQEDIDKFSYIEDIKRRTLAAMIYQLDKSVGEIVKALKDNNHLDDSIVIFYSDNGGPTTGLHSTAASNYPLRGQKQSGWEGAIRTNAIVYAPSLPKAVVRNNLFYIADWLPTLKTIAGANFKINTKIDGIDQTKMLYNNRELRNELVTIDDVFGFGSYIFNGLKLVNGSSSNGQFDSWLGSNNNTNAVDDKAYMENLLLSPVAKSIKPPITLRNIDRMRSSAKICCTKEKNKQSCDLLKGPCLYNLNDDPCEENNIANRNKILFSFMLLKYKNSLADLVPTRRKLSDPQCDPVYFNYTWNAWQQNS
ncbi:hypothetical protein ACKWTF_008813 [Chironomus riparius]